MEFTLMKEELKYPVQARTEVKAVVSHGIGTAGIYTYGGSVTLQAGSVKVWGDGEENDAMETKGGGSIYAFGGSVHITSLDPNGTGVQLLSFNGNQYHN